MLCVVAAAAEAGLPARTKAGSGGDGGGAGGGGAAEGGESGSAVALANAEFNMLVVLSNTLACSLRRSLEGCGQLPSGQQAGGTRGGGLQTEGAMELGRKKRRRDSQGTGGAERDGSTLLGGRPPPSSVVHGLAALLAAAQVGCMVSSAPC